MSRRWASSMATSRSDCPRICCRPSGTTLGAHVRAAWQEVKFVHTNWTGKGGNVSTTTYLAQCDEHDAAG
ncbi:6-phosphogluconate dehydrogenase [Culex quinquefasciatus]|uniref:6-phosphogluconate dehydrogenase n=1 Tax=Culex quinquefasciatus TaxID=7176 RepID=B0WPE5_CULQU|nr:6-phosphogluconate dehydrogenase [Culex quinquefasciatus]|eukprot:XP_001850579.1 6-phosphogluconate dehydrogenase [Culex quinquefasciatus]